MQTKCKRGAGQLGVSLGGALRKILLETTAQTKVLSQNFRHNVMYEIALEDQPPPFPLRV